MKHFDHTHANAFDLLTCSATGITPVLVKPDPQPKRRADYRTQREIKQYGALPR